MPFGQIIIGRVVEFVAFGAFNGVEPVRLRDLLGGQFANAVGIGSGNLLADGADRGAFAAGLRERHGQEASHKKSCSHGQRNLTTDGTDFKDSGRWQAAH